MLVPRFGVDFMVGEFRRLGFEHVTEFPHGRVHELAPGVSVASFQYGFDDTLLVVADHDTVLFDVNDCKIRGRPFRQIVRRFGSPDVMLKSHSFAQGYPNCYDAADPDDLALVSTAASSTTSSCAARGGPASLRGARSRSTPSPAGSGW